MANINLTIDGVEILAPSDSTILEAASVAGIRIPTLCHLKDRNVQANCRVCLVQVAGGRALESACSTRVRQGMNILTDTPDIREARKMSLELILSNHSWDCHHCMRIGSSKCNDLDPHFCEMCFFCDCVRDGNCELQALAREYQVDALPFDWEPDAFSLDDSTGCVVRNPNKCIKCRRCVEVCNREQTVHALALENRGGNLRVSPAMGKKLAETDCVRCGRCIDVCPTGAIYALEGKDEFLYQIRMAGGDAKSIVMLSPDVCMELEKLNGMGDGELDIGSVVAGLRKIGVDCVVSADESVADMKGAALAALERAFKGNRRPLIASNSYAAIRFLREQFSDLSGFLVPYPSVQAQFGRAAKSVWARACGIEPKKVFAVSVVPGCEGKAELIGNTDVPVDLVLNPRELHRLFVRTGVDLARIPPGTFDALGTDATEPNTPLNEILDCDSYGRGIREREVALPGGVLHVAVATNLGESRSLLSQVREGRPAYDLIKLST